jgi:tetratricopeptide (TPR) repeat protein
VIALVLLLADPSARELERRGEAAFEQHRFDDAAAAFAQAYARDPRPSYLYARAQAERFGGHCDRAVPTYRAYLELAPADDAAALARENLAACERELAPAPEPAAAAPAPMLPARATPPPPDSSPRRWHRDPWGGALLGVGLASTTGGAVLLGLARVHAGAADDARSVVDYGHHIDRGRTFQRAGIAVLVTGGVLLGAAILRYAIVGARARARTRGLALRF